MNLLGKAADPKFWAEIKNNPEYKFALDALMRDYNSFCIGEVETTKFSKFLLFKERSHLVGRKLEKLILIIRNFGVYFTGEAMSKPLADQSVFHFFIFSLRASEP